MKQPGVAYAERDNPYKPLSLVRISATTTAVPTLPDQEPVEETLWYVNDPRDPHKKEETDKSKAFLQQFPGCRTTRPCRYKYVIQFWIVFNSKPCFNSGLSRVSPYAHITSSNKHVTPLL
jgi:hypothetical protein